METRIGTFLDRSRASVEGTLRIVADSALHITDAVSAFRQAHPKVFVSIRSGNTEEVLTRLRNYEADVGVVGNISPAHDLDLIDLGRSPIVVIAARGVLPPDLKTINFDDLTRWPLIFREQGSRTRANIEEEQHRRGLSLIPSIEVEGREAMREVVASGAGLGFVSLAELGHDKRLVAVPLADTALGMSEAAVTLTARRDVPVIRAFLKTMNDEVHK